MAKQGMKKPDPNKDQKPKNEAASVGIIQGKAKSGKEKAKPMT